MQFHAGDEVWACNDGATIFESTGASVGHISPLRRTAPLTGGAVPRKRGLLNVIAASQKPRWKRRRLSSGPLDHHPCRHDQQLDVQPEAPVLDIGCVQGDV